MLIGGAIVAVSFKDVLLIDEFKYLTQFDLLPRSMDSKVFPYLYNLGCDIDKPNLVQACKHRRCNSPETTVGYRYVFFERLDEDWMKNSMCSMSARIHAQPDKDLAADMIRASCQGIGESGFRAMVMAAAGKEGMTKSQYQKKGELVEDYAETVDLIKCFQEIQISQRGLLAPEEDVFYNWK